jgi:hypothetical protein
MVLLIQMINWLADDLMKYPGAILDPMTDPDVQAA